MCSFKFWIKSIEKKRNFLMIFLKYQRKTNNFLNPRKYDFNL